MERLQIDGLGVEIDFLDFCVGTHHEVLAPKRNREHSIGDQVVTLNAGCTERLRLSLGYWLKHHCRCLWGNDRAKRFDRFKPSGQEKRDLHSHARVMSQGTRTLSQKSLRLSSIFFLTWMATETG